MQYSHEEPAAEPGEARVLARGRGASDLKVELLQGSDGSISVAFGLDTDRGPMHEWPAGDVENGVRTFLNLVRRRGTS
jgi:hypothetical protein